MDNSPGWTGYNTETQRLAREARMDIRTTDSYYPWENKAESVIITIKGKYKRRRLQRNIPKRVWEFGMVWEAEIHSCTAGKYGGPAL